MPRIANTTGARRHRCLLRQHIGLRNHRSGAVARGPKKIRAIQIGPQDPRLGLCWHFCQKPEKCGKHCGLAAAPKASLQIHNFHDPQDRNEPKWTKLAHTKSMKIWWFDCSQVFWAPRYPSSSKRRTFNYGKAQCSSATHVTGDPNNFPSGGHAHQRAEKQQLVSFFSCFGPPHVLTNWGKSYSRKPERSISNNIMWTSPVFCV